MSDGKELDDKILRLRRETEVAHLIRELERLTGKKPKLKANKNLSIKEANDDELDAILRRLEKELRVQSVLSDIKRKSEVYPSNGVHQVSTEEPINNLYHFGIKGMKWGVRRSQAQLARARKTLGIGNDESEDSAGAKQIATKRLGAMSNTELKQLNTRLQLEKQYKDLTKTEKKKGQKFVEDILVNSAKTSLQTQVTKQMSNALDKAFNQEKKTG